MELKLEVHVISETRIEVGKTIKWKSEETMELKLEWKLEENYSGSQKWIGM